MIQTQGKKRELWEIRNNGKIFFLIFGMKDFHICPLKCWKVKEQKKRNSTRKI